MTELVKPLSLSNPLELCSDHFFSQICRQGVSVRSLLSCQMELYYPLRMYSKNMWVWQTQNFDKLRPNDTLNLFKLWVANAPNVYGERMLNKCQLNVLLAWRPLHMYLLKRFFICKVVVWGYFSEEYSFSLIMFISMKKLSNKLILLWNGAR
jgi:hypothetical protein